MSPKGTRNIPVRAEETRITGVIPNRLISIGVTTIAVIAPIGASPNTTPQTAKVIPSRSMYSGTQATEQRMMCPRRRKEKKPAVRVLLADLSG